MLLEQNQIAQYLDENIDKIALDQKICEKFCNRANEKFGVEPADVMDYLAKRKSTYDAGIFDLYMLTWTFDRFNKTEKIKEFFTDLELREFRNTKIHRETIKFPIRIKCIRVAEDQWIGACDVKFLMMLRDAQMINYNINAQRTMKRYVRGGTERYRIHLNMTAVKQIEESFDDDGYIPNTITLNIPEDEVNFTYDNKANELVIQSLKHFDISDGYHRYMAMALEHDKDPNFNYPMELRIIHFADSKTKQFIFQEDQKTQMKKIVSQSYNENAPENLVTERLNEDPRFVFKGMISRNNGVIPFPEFAKCVKYFYFPRKIDNKAKRAAEVMKVKNDLVEKLNIAFADPDKYKDHYTFKDLMIIFTAIKNYDEAEVPDLVGKALDKEDTLNGYAFQAERATKKAESTVLNWLKEEVSE